MSLNYVITVTSYWVRWRHKSPASRLFAQPFVQGAHQRKYQSSVLPDLFEENPPITGGFPSQRASNAENVSIWWRHHAIIASGYGLTVFPSGRFLNQHRLIVKKVPRNFGGGFIKTISPRRKRILKCRLKKSASISVFSLISIVVI